MAYQPKFTITPRILALGQGIAALRRADNRDGTRLHEGREVAPDDGVRL